MKIGVITMHRVLNYGSFLQAYATQEFFKSIGYECEIIDYKFPNKYQRKDALNKNRSLKSIIRNCLKWIPLTPNIRKDQKISKAIKKYLNISRCCYKSRESLKNNPPKYDVYVVGSDQTWNPKHTKGDDSFFLSFAPQEKMKFSFSASVSTNNIDDRYKELFSYNLKTFDFISVREDGAKSFLENLTGKTVNVVLDPTLFCTGDMWHEFSDCSKYKIRKEKYILFYGMTHSFSPYPYAYDLLNALQKKTGYIIYSFDNMPEYIRSKCVAGVSPQDWVALISGACCVVTSSFHATAFSINLGVPVYSIIDTTVNDDRVTSLLEKVNANVSIVPKGTNVNEVIDREMCVDEYISNLSVIRERDSQLVINSLKLT